MLKVGGVVSSFFQLVLEIPSELTSDAIDKRLRVPDIFLEKSLELWPRYRSGVFVVALMLGPSKVDGATGEDGGKQVMIHPGGTCCFEVIFTLLTKMVVGYVEFSGISFRGPGLKWAILELQ